MSRQPANRRYPRVARVNEVVREVIGEELERLSDPRLELVTVTGVDVKADLRNATVYYSTFRRSDEELEDVERALVSVSPLLRQRIGQQVRLKSTPAITFVLDPAIVAGERIDDLLRDDAERPG